MNPQKLTLEEAARQALSVTLENMAFEEVFALDGKPDDYKEDIAKFWTRLTITTPIKGAMAITLCQACAERLVRTILGPMVDENEIEPGMIRDTIGELINTVAGRFMNLIVSKEQEFAIGLPETGEGSAFDEADVYKHIFFQVSDDYIVVTLAGSDFTSFEVA